MDGHLRIAEQSKYMLTKGLIDLMKSNKYADISVKDIANNAGLSRRTFYRTFKNKEAVLDSIGMSLILGYIQELRTFDDKQLTFSAVISIFFQYWWKHKATAQVLIGQDLFISVLLKATRDERSIKMYDLFKMPWHVDGSEDDIKYTMIFFTGGYWSVINSWLAEDHPMNPNKMSDILALALKSLSKVTESLHKK